MLKKNKRMLIILTAKRIVNLFIFIYFLGGEGAMNMFYGINQDDQKQVLITNEYFLLHCRTEMYNNIVTVAFIVPFVYKLTSQQLLALCSAEHIFDSSFALICVYSCK